MEHQLPGVLTGFAVILSIVFALSAAGKFADVPGTKSALHSLRIPVPALHPVLAIAVPAFEVAVAVGLWTPWRPVAALAAGLGLALMLAFTAVIARALGFDEAVHCSCFGTLGSPTVSRETLMRNIVLSGLALVTLVLALVGDGIFPGRLLAESPLAALALAVVVAAAAGVALLISGGTSRLAGEESAGSGTGRGADSGSAGGGAGVGDADDELEDYVRTPIPFAALHDPEAEGVQHTLRELASQRAVLLIFVSAGCGSCTQLFPQVADWKERLDPLVSLVTVIRSGTTNLRPEYREQLEGTVMADPGGTVSRIFDLHRTPSAVLLGADGLLAGGPVGGVAGVREFVDEVLAELEAAGPVPEDGAAS